MKLKMSSALGALLISSSIYAANDPVITIVTSFSKTGGIYGDGKLSVVGGIVNGVNICPSANNNNNDVPGCDMEQDPGYSDNATTDPSDDKYTGDLIVRTNDIFEMNVAWNGTNVDNDIILTSTLPSFNGNNYLRWEPLPSSCKAGSSISEDGLTLTCVRTDDTSISYSEDSKFYVKVKGNTPNNTKTGPIAFTISSDGLESKTDDTDGYELTVTASPKWNIEKKYVSYSKQTYNDVEGYVVRYAYLLEADEVIGEEDTTSAVMGNEALGKNITLSFTDDVSEISPNAELVGCDIEGANINYDPYPWYHSDAPDRSVGSLEENLNITCSQPSGKGSDISVDYSGIDASLEHVATKTGTGIDIPTTRLPLASGVIDIFVPITDINSSDNLQSNDIYQLTTVNTITSFDPDSISGQSNFGTGTESTKDNSANLTLVYTGPGYIGGDYHKYFTNSIDGEVLPDATNIYYSADGIVTPDKMFGAWAYVQNSGNKDFNDTILCDVIDANLYDVVDMDINSSSAVKLYSSTAELNHTIEYATGYVGSWPPPINEDNSIKVIDECKNEAVQWFSTTEEARASGNPITKVRLRIPDGLPAQKSAGFTINLKARSTDLNGAVIPTGTELVNYSAMHDTVYLENATDNWHGASRILNEYPTATLGGNYRADRAILMRAKVRTSKVLSMATVEPSDEVEVTIHSTFTTDNENGESDNVKITELLDPGLSYVIGSANIGDPVFGTCDDLEDSDSLKSICTAEHQVLVWDLGQKTANQPLTDINYKFIVGAITSQGTNHTYTIISSPTDTSNVDIRKANQNINISIPSALFISKEVNTPFREIDQSPIEFTSYARNGSSTNLTNIDIIDILPFNGDGTDGFTFTVGSTVVEKRRYEPTAFNGTLEFESASGGYACENGVVWYYTNRNPKLMDIAPTATSNKSGGDTTWCAGTSTGPDSSCGFDNAGVTAVRLTGPALDTDATCSFKVFLKPLDNKKGDIYTNTASAYAEGVTLPTLSNDVSAIVPSTLLGDLVWIDSNANGIQDIGELGASGITLELLDSSNSVLKTTISDSSGRYIFEDLTEDTEYKVKATIPAYYSFSPKSQGSDDTKDSDVDTTTGITGTKTLNLNQQYKHLDIGLTSNLTISGKVYKKENNDSISNVAVKLYIDKNDDDLLDDGDTLVTSLDSDENGEYLFTNVFDGNYIVVIDKNDSDIPDGYVLADKKVLDVTVDKESVVDKNFPFAIAPTSDDKINDAIMNISDAIVLKDLTGADEDGSVVGFIINSLPTDAQGVLYMSDGATVVNVGQELSLDEAKGLKFDPKEGYVGDVVFTYSSKDNDGNVDATPATVTIPVIAEILISGTIYADGNGDKNINGIAISNADETALYVTLVRDGTVLASTLLDDTGAYSFGNSKGVFPNTTYTLVLSTQESGTEASLPINWNNADGENINSKSLTGNDGQIDGEGDGKIIVEVATLSIPKIDFGINKKPVAEDKNATTQANPSRTNRVLVPTLNMSDNEDKTPTTITVTVLPDNATLYYNGEEISSGEVILNFDVNKFEVDPNDGNVTAVFKYTTTDKAGVVSNEATVTMPFTDIAISGKLFDDGNANGNVDGNLTAKADNTQLYVTLVDANGDAVASKPLGADGTYSFSNVDGVTPNTDYTMVLSDKANRTTPNLPENWNNADGENIGLNGLDRDANGIVTVNVASTHIPEINFGINKKPVADDKTEPTQFNPGSDVQVSVPTLTVSDKEDGTPAIVTIRTLPINATLYYDGAEVTADMEIADLTLLTVDPDDGDQTVLFTYTSTDVTGMVSNLATVTMSFKGIKIAGNIFNDGNADGTVNGTPIASPNGTQLHATLLDVNGTAIATAPIAEDGTYSFGNKDGVLPNHSYSVVLSTTANSNEASLPVNWNNADGEHIGTNKGLDDAPDGVINVTVVEKDVVEVNFGINKKPVAGDNTGELQLNPGTDVQVNVIDLNVSDSEDTTPSTVTIKTVPSNGTLYYDGVEVVANQVIENFDNSKLTLDPNNGSLTVSFTYTTTDGSGVESDIATIAMPFKGLKISGNIFNDGNNNGIVDGDLTSKADEVALYAVLLDSNGNFMAREAIKADGSYDFDGLDGIVPNSTYNVVLTSDANGTTAMLPNTWTNADGEHIGADAGLDGRADGAIEVAVTIVDVPEVNFGINKRPVSDDKTELEQLNISRDAQYVVPTLMVSDKEDGIPLVITIRTLPTNGMLYYEGTPVELNATIADPSKLTIDPDDGDQNVTFTYTSTDVTGAISDPATVVMPFIGVKISGYIFADGNNDETVNGTQIATVDGVQLYATLLNENNETLATVAIDSNGSYLFENRDGVYPNNNYYVVLSTEANATTASLPENWNHADGEHIGRDKGLDDNANGVIDVSVVTTDVPEVNFGINKRPVVEDVTSVVQANPGADKQIKVIDLGIIDNEDGSPKTVTIVSLPTDGTLYYDGVAVEKGQIIPNFDNKLLTVDPKNGATKIEFDYTTTDNTGWESEKATATMPFAAVAPAENFTAEDDVQPASLEGPVTTINVLENDVLGENSTIHLLDINDGTVLWNEGTAVGSATINTQDSVVVPGEGVWTVSGSTVVFTAEEGFTGIPTPIYYVVEDDQGNQTNVAQVAVISNCVCDTYEKSASDSVSALNPWWMLVGMFFISTLGVLFARREFEEIN